jgi:hypothetical protein
MAHTETHIPRSPEEEIYLDCLKNGDDFSKIEILYLAKYWYQKALETGFEPELMKKRLDKIDQNLRFERKVVTILVVIATVIILGIFIFRSS